MYSSDDRNDSENAALTVAEFSPLAYVRPVDTEKGPAFGVYSADGTQLAVFASQEAAFFAAKQHELEPVLIH